jgi:chemotaxis signal transduction protein
MSLSEQHLEHQLLALRQHFDHAFTLPFAEQGAPQVKVLGVGIRGRSFSIALLQLGGVHRRPKITAVPSLVPEMLGVAGIRGVLVPVYDLGALIGLPPRSDSSWIALAQDKSVGLAFDEFLGHSTMDSRIYEQATPDATGLTRIPELEVGSRPIVNVPALIDLIVRRAERSVATKDRPE